MKTGRSIVELATELERQAAAKRDFIAQTQAMRIIPGDKDVTLGMGDIVVPIAPLAHGQIAGHTEIPVGYYNRMREAAPDLLARNVEHWLHANPAKRMVRTLDGRCRAFLSDRYRPLENAELAEAVLPVLGDLGVEIMSAEVTETRLYIKAVDARITRDVPAGHKMRDGSHHFFDTLSPAIVISNSEVGCGALSVETAVWTKVCTNLAIAGQRSMRKYHTGNRHDLGDDILRMLSDETRRLTDAAVWAQARDIVRGAFDQARFDATVNEIKGMTEQKIDGDPVKAIDIAGRKLGLVQEERTSVLRHLIEGGDLSRYGLFNAVTRAAQDIETYDRATDLEKMGGRVIELAANDWREIALAA